MSKRIVIKQVRGAAGRDPATKATLRALGLGRIGKQREYNANPAILGMARRVAHLVSVQEL